MKKHAIIIAAITTFGLSLAFAALPTNTAHAATEYGTASAVGSKTTVLSEKERKAASIKIYKQTFADFKAGDEAAAVQDLETATTMGNTVAAAELGELYQNGFHDYHLSTGFDYAKAKIWNTIASNMGAGRGFTNNGILYYNGWGVTKNIDTAATYFKKGYALKDMKAPRYLGMIYDAKKEYTKAAKYYKAAYASGDITGGINLAQLYLDGNGVKKSTTKAIAIYKNLLKNANGNSKAGDAAVAWGDLYTNGKYVTKDLAKAKTIYQKGVALNSDAAKAALEKIQ